jgi:hypothetical protein
VAIEDDGPIPPDTRRLFEPFFTTKYSGTARPLDLKPGRAARRAIEVTSERACPDRSGRVGNPPPRGWPWRRSIVEDEKPCAALEQQLNGWRRGHRPARRRRRAACARQPDVFSSTSPA